MAFTHEQIARRMNQVDLSIVGLLEQILDATTDEPDTPADESKITRGEALDLGLYGMATLVPNLIMAVRDLDGTSFRDLVEAYKSRMDIQ